ncbi:MAG TPA: DUF1080 domain-containing protein [Chitinophagaceae bacterium]|jgi:hypothetical protein|nr:DUF1080 domain-containing protein [Chitinophagaceae bacterium]
MGKFINSLVAFALAAGVTACGSTGKSSSMTSTEENTANGWSPLFDGKSLVGWHSYGTKTAGSWRALNGTITLDTSAGKTRQRGDLVSNESFENYHLSLEWKLAPGGNSGIIFNVQDDAAKYRNTYETGPEMQVLDNERHSDAKIPKHRAGDLYDLISSSKETVKAVGEWNTAEIKLDKGKLDFYLNGTNIVSTTMWDDNWKNMLANSKFKAMPGFGSFKSGHIALQDHGDPVWFRNIKIKRL